MTSRCPCINCGTFPSQPPSVMQKNKKKTGVTFATGKVSDQFVFVKITWSGLLTRAGEWLGLPLDWSNPLIYNRLPALMNNEWPYCHLAWITFHTATGSAGN